MRKPKLLPIEELKKICQVCSPTTIVRGKSYLYFSITPTTDAVTFAVKAEDPRVAIYEAVNERSATIGYCVLIKSNQKNQLAQNSDYGVGLYFSRARQYRRMKALFTDTRFRAVRFGGVDYFFSTKWKSGQDMDPTGWAQHLRR
jgi:hypothetical protein